MKITYLSLMLALLANTHARTQSVTVRCIQTAALHHTPETGCSPAIQSVAWHPKQFDSQYLFACSTENSIALYTWGHDKLTQRLHIPFKQNSLTPKVTWHPRLPLLITNTATTLVLWAYDIKKNKLSLDTQLDILTPENIHQKDECIIMYSWHPTMKLEGNPVLACLTGTKFNKYIRLYTYDAQTNTLTHKQTFNTSHIINEPVIAWHPRYHILTYNAQWGQLYNIGYDSQTNRFQIIQTPKNDDIVCFRQLCWHSTKNIIACMPACPNPNAPTDSTSYGQTYKGHILQLWDYNILHNTRTLLFSFDPQKIDPEHACSFKNPTNISIHDLHNPPAAAWHPHKEILALGSFGTTQPIITLWAVDTQDTRQIKFTKNITKAPTKAKRSHAILG